jgi:hypothetical protein
MENNTVESQYSGTGARFAEEMEYLRAQRRLFSLSNLPNRSGVRGESYGSQNKRAGTAR